MNRENIAYALGQVDEEYIVEAASSTTVKVRKYRSKWGAIAACLTLTVILVASVAAATGMLDPILSYFQSEEEIYMEEILAPSYSVSNEKVQLRLEGAIADEDACYMVVSLIDLTGGKRLDRLDIHEEYEVYGVLENGDRATGGCTSSGTYTRRGKAMSYFPDAAQTMVIMYEPKYCGMRDVKTVCFNYDSLVLEVEPANYMSPHYKLVAENDSAPLTDVGLSRIGFSFVQPLSDEISSEELAYDIRLIRADGSVLSKDEMRVIGSAHSISTAPDLEETKIKGEWGSIPSLTIINLDEYCGLQINGENYYVAS